MAHFYVNVDHVATVRQARGTVYPCPVALAQVAEAAGVHGITAHLREDRRHVNDEDIRKLSKVCRVPFNFEMSVAEEIVQLAEELAPPQATLVPEKRQEVTTEGGLDLRAAGDRVLEVTRRLQDRNIMVSLFIDADDESIQRSHDIGAECIELHTGPYADATTHEKQTKELQHLIRGAAKAQELGLIVNAGHGLHRENVQPIAQIEGMNDLNIGHAIVARSLTLGMDGAIREMLQLIEDASC